MDPEVIKKAKEENLDEAEAQQLQELVDSGLDIDTAFELWK